MAEFYEATVEELIAIDKEYEDRRIQLAKDCNFFFRRPQYYKDCVVIRWKHRKRKDKDFIDYERIQEYCRLARDICQEYNLREPISPLMEMDLLLAKIGIYSYYGTPKIWAISNKYPEIIKKVLKDLPEWAIVTQK